MSGSFCGGCGAPRAAGARFCGRCGTPCAVPAQAERKPTLWPVLAGSGLVLVLVLVVAVLAISAARGGRAARPPSLVAVASAGSAAPASGARSGAGGPGASGVAGASVARTAPVAPAGSAAAGGGPPGGASPPDLSWDLYRGTRLTAEIPAGWTALEEEAQKQGYVESKWRDPADASDTVLIDESPAPHVSLQQSAAPVHEALERASGYQELYYGRGDLGDGGSWMWVFRVSGDERIDYFFERCEGGFAVLGSAPPGRFEELRGLFRAVAESVRATCR